MHRTRDRGPAGDLLRLGQPFEGMHILHKGEALWRIGKSPPHGSVGAPRQQGVDPHPLCPILGGQHLGQANEARLARRIGRHAGQPQGMADKGRGKNKRATAASLHGGDLVLGPHKGAGEIGIQRFLPLRQFKLLYAARRACGTGVVEGDIEPAETG